MFNAIILLTPYLAIASSAVLAIAIGTICHSQTGRDAAMTGFDV
jgi:hypothetical protein